MTARGHHHIRIGVRHGPQIDRMELGCYEVELILELRSPFPMYPMWRFCYQRYEIK